MSKSSLPENSYDLETVKALRRRRRRKMFFRAVPVVLLFSGLIAAASLYVSRLPRERHARNFSFAEKVIYGISNSVKATYLKMTAIQSDPGNTPLPIAELYMKGHRFDRLTENLPVSGRDYQKAELKIGDKTYKAEARFRGDSINHWAFPARSWRVKLRKGKFYNGMEYFNLVVPRSDNQIANWLGYQMAERFEGILVPETEYVHFRFNRRYDGVRMLLEQPNQDFLRRRNLVPGKIFNGDISSEHIYGEESRKHLYKDSSAWEVESPTDNIQNIEMVELLRIIREEHDPYRFYELMQRIVDINGVMNYIALLDMVGSVHVDETHNGKFYFNPISGRFSPIGWDTVAYFWKNRHQLDFASNSFFRVLLSNPAFRELKDRALWTAMQGELSEETLHKMIDRQVALITPDIKAFALKLHANDKGINHVSNSEWEQAIVDLKKVITERHATIRDHLAASNAAYRIEPAPHGANFAVQVRSYAGMHLGRVAFTAKNAAAGTPVVIRRRGINDIPGNLKETAGELSTVVNADGIVSIAFNDHLFSKRGYDNGEHRKVPRLVPATYVYEVVLPDGVTLEPVADIQAMNAISRAPFELTSDQALKVASKHKTNSVWWHPEDFLEPETTLLQGEVEIKEDLIIDGGILEVAAGTVIKAGEGVSILVRNGRIRMNGTAEKPIQIEPLNDDKNWGTLAALRSDVQLKHVNVTAGSHDTIDFIRYEGAVSFYDSEVNIQGGHYRDNFIKVREGAFRIRNVTYESIFQELFQIENAEVQAKQIEKKGYTPVVTPAILEKEAHGTPRRIEREFKWTLDGIDTESVDLMLVADEINSALRASVQTGVWEAPKFTGTSYFCDPEAKEFMFRDIYFDTEDRLNYKHDIAYRLRNRYKSLGKYEEYLDNPYWTEAWPYRIEFQGKVNKVELGNGFSTAEEARFEFRDASDPFSPENQPPAAPWDLKEFIPHFQAGHYKGITTYAAQEVVKALHQVYPDRKEYEFKPSVVLVTRRMRSHFNIKSDWGSGPNPEQSYIISLDHAIVYDGPAYMNFLESKMLGDKELDVPAELGNLVEIELEFERNVSDVLDRKIREAEEKGDEEALKHLIGARDAFLKDQQTIMEVIKAHFAELGIDAFPASKSKYNQAVDLRY